MIPAACSRKAESSNNKCSKPSAGVCVFQPMTRMAWTLNVVDLEKKKSKAMP